MDSPFENLVIFGDYFLVRCDVYSIKGAYAFRRFFLLLVWWQIQITLYQITRRLIAEGLWLHTHTCRDRNDQ